MKMLNKETEQRQAIELYVHGHAGAERASAAENRRSSGLHAYL